jgi:hypothetical protein
MHDMRILYHGWQFACKVAAGEKVCNQKSRYHPRNLVGREARASAVRNAEYDWPKGYRKWG